MGVPSSVRFTEQERRKMHLLRCVEFWLDDDNDDDP